VPVRDFNPDGDSGLAAGAGRDQGAAYVIVFGVGYRPTDLLRGGEALSAVLLRAAVEVTWPRHLLRYLLSGLGEPYVVVRLGYADTTDPLPPAPRRAAVEIIDIVPG
jgi:hypothetical protein